MKYKRKNDLIIYSYNLLLKKIREQVGLPQLIKSSPLGSFK